MHHREKHTSVEHVATRRIGRKFQRGFTFIEVLVVMAVMAVMGAIMFSALSNYAARQTLESVTQDVRIGAVEVRSKTLASRNNTVYGMYIGTTSITMFEGASYVASSTSNTYIPYDNRITASASLTGGVSSIVFARLTGEPSATGTIHVVDTLTNASTTITIYGTGLVE